MRNKKVQVAFFRNQQQVKKNKKEAAAPTSSPPLPRPDLVGKRLERRRRPRKPDREVSRLRRRKRKRVGIVRLRKSEEEAPSSNQKTEHRSRSRNRLVQEGGPECYGLNGWEKEKKILSVTVEPSTEGPTPRRKRAARGEKGSQTGWGRLSHREEEIPLNRHRPVSAIGPKPKVLTVA